MKGGKLSPGAGGLRVGAHRPRPAGAPCPAPARPCPALPSCPRALPALQSRGAGAGASPSRASWEEVTQGGWNASLARPRLPLASSCGCCSGQAPGSAAAVQPGASARRGLLSRRPAAAMPHFTVVPVEDKARAGYDDLEGLSWVDYSQPGEDGAPRQRDPYDSVSSDGEWRGSGGAGWFPSAPGAALSAGAWRGAAPLGEALWPTLGSDARGALAGR